VDSLARVRLRLKALPPETLARRLGLLGPTLNSKFSSIATGWSRCT
jgi:hypothetical protein